MIGYYLSANIVRSAINDWNKNPVITSLDSIATPIEDVQFPTVTVCDDKPNEVHDNWSFIESLFNFLNIQCQTPASQIKSGDYCNFTEPLRHDFNFLIESIVDVSMKYMMNEENLEKTRKYINDDSRGTPYFSRLLRRASEVIKSGNMTFEELRKIPISYFKKYMGTENVSIHLVQKIMLNHYCILIHFD